MLLAGCADDGPVEKLTIDSESRPLGPADGKAAGKPKKAERQKAEKQKARRQAVLAPTAGVRLRLPAGLVVIDKAAVDAGADSDRVAQVAREAGYTVEQLKQVFAGIDVFAAGFSSTLTVGRPAGGSSLPSQAAFEASLAALSAEVAPFATVETPIGPGRRFTYSYALSGADVHGVSVYVAQDGIVMEMSVGGTDRDQVGDLVDQVLPTLAPA